MSVVLGCAGMSTMVFSAFGEEIDVFGSVFHKLIGAGSCSLTRSGTIYHNCGLRTHFCYCFPWLLRNREDLREVGIAITGKGYHRGGRCNWLFIHESKTSSARLLHIEVSDIYGPYNHIFTIWSFGLKSPRSTPLHPLQCLQVSYPASLFFQHWSLGKGLWFKKSS